MLKDYISLPYPPVPKTQALTSITFKPAALGGSLTLPEIYDWHYHNSATHPLFAFADAPNSVREISWSEAVQAMHTVGRIVKSRLSNEEFETKIPIVAILAATDIITYFTVMTGIERANCTVFPISPRNSPAAIAHLLKMTSTTHVLVGSEPALAELAAASLTLMEEGVFRPQTSLMPSFQDIYKASDGPFELLPLVKPSIESIGIIMHSSGSTAFPKPIYWSHYQLIQLAMSPSFGERDLTGVRLGCHAMPMYHGMGNLLTAWTAGSGVVVTAFKPQSPATQPTSDAVIQAGAEDGTNIMFCVPSFIENWSRDPTSFNAMKKMHGVLYGGGPLNKEVGDDLAQKGVTIFILYGSTEMGVASPILPLTVGRYWGYFPITAQMIPIFEPDGHGNAELVMIPGPFHTPCVFNDKRGEVDVYRTYDLLTEHPDKPGFWKVHGRADDQIMHNTGEKTNPGPLESILIQDIHVQSAVMFGRGKFNAGLLIDPAPGHIFDPSDTDQLKDFRDKLWPTVERLNLFAPQHSRIFKEMIIVANPSKPFTYTAKNTARRQAILIEYEPEIEGLYKAIEQTAQSHIPLPSSWEHDKCLEYVRALVVTILGRHVGDIDDIFQCGADSLQALWIRSSIGHALHTLPSFKHHHVHGNLVYQHPSISALALYVSRVVDPSAETQIGQTSKVDEMLSLADKYSMGLGVHVPLTTISLKETVLITGTTGGLGTALLSELIACENIARIFAFNRHARDGTSVLHRQQAAVRAQGLDENLVCSPKLVLLEGDSGTATLGLPSDILEAIRVSVTHIIHNAWPVDFNHTLKSFEPQLQSVRNLVDLALSSPQPTPPRILFISSAGVVRHAQFSETAAEVAVPPATAVGSGYTESKWVAERLLQLAALESPLNVVIVRVGQISGGPTGYWRSKEWFPSLVRSSVHIKAFPDGNQLIAWIPSNIAAKAIVEMRHSPSQFLHLAHPRPVLWSSVARALSATLGLPLVPYAEWLMSLNKSNNFHGAGEGNPALRIIDFFRSASTNGDQATEAMGMSRLDLTQAMQASPTLRDGELRQIGTSDVEGWLAYWRKTGFMPI